ncbi:MAG: hypothetical protein ACJAU9_000569 [Lentimonas sp.]|jgi:hypothetical protein
MSSDAHHAQANKVGSIALIVGLIGIALAAVGLIQGWNDSDARPFMGWLLGIGFWMSIAIGMTFLTLIWYVFYARWPVIIRRQCEHCMAAFPWLLLLFLPLLAIPLFHENPGLLWKWMSGLNELPGHGTVGEDAIYNWKQPYLNINFFVFRVFAIFGVFILITSLLRKWSFDTDKTGDIKNTTKAHALSSVGLFICAVAMSLGAIDWFKSLEYHWFSTMYGVWFFAASMRAALSILVILVVVLASKGYLKGILNQAHRYDLGCLMLTFTIFWAYISFSQYFLIYSANIPEETFWYNLREMNFDGTTNSWWWVSMGLIFGHFLTPFLCLLWYKTKTVVWRTVAISGWILTFHLVDLYWNIIPGKLVNPDAQAAGYLVRQFSVSWVDIASLVGIGGICVYAFCRSTKKAEPIPIRDPNIVISINYSE